MKGDVFRNDEEVKKKLQIAHISGKLILENIFKIT